MEKASSRGAKQQRFRDWCFTLNNYSAQREQIFVAGEDGERLGSWKYVPELYFELGEWRDDIAYFVCQQEVGERGTPHLQGFIQFKNAKSLTAVTSLCGMAGSHLEVRKGTPQEAADYCQEEETRDPNGVGPFTIGQIRGTREGQGHRSDWELVHELARGGAELVEFLDQVPHLSYPNIGRIPAWRAAHDAEVRRWKTRPIIFYGPPRAGKSTLMRKLAEQHAREYGRGVFEKSDHDKWWDGYSGEYVITIDEMFGGYFEWNALLKFFEEGSYRVQYKGGSRHMVAKVVYMTCNLHPAFWYKGRAWDETNAFRSRVLEFGELWVFSAPERDVAGNVVYKDPVRDVELKEPVSPVIEAFRENAALFGPPN